jgi:hypothetical protein
MINGGGKMDPNVKENVKNVDTWMRGLFIIIFGVIFYFLIGIIWLLVIFQFFTKVITGNLNEQLEKFSSGLTQYALQILDYVTFQSETRPFPFSPLPGTASGPAGTTKAKEKVDPDKPTEQKAD